MLELVNPLVRRVAVLVGCLLAAAVLVWRGNTYPDPNPDLTVPLMCIASAMTLVLTGVAVCFRGDPADATS